MVSNPAYLTTRYDTMRPHLEKLEKFVINRLWADLSDLRVLHIEGRIKEVGSVLQKLHTGKYQDLQNLRDLVGVTVVTLYRRDVQVVMDVVRNSGLTIYPVTPKPVQPSDFRYREPKLCVEAPPDYLDRNPELRGVTCEIQFTSALQNALDLTTHDFDYKGRSYSWTNFRLVAQLRAMLELVDRMIDDIESVDITQSESIVIPDEVLNAESVLKVLHEVFEEDELPPDRRRLADTVASWLEAAGIEVQELKSLLDASSDLREASSLDVSSVVLGALTIARGQNLVDNYSGMFVVSEELQSLCSEVGIIPADRRVNWASESD
jgi:ppGpp synthetase/RelA/SpoT-type nucleotidyltranferase